MSTIRGHPGMAIRGALDVVGLGAQRNEEMIIIRRGIDMARINRIGLYPRQITIMVSIVHSYKGMGFEKWV